jgi:hypothetical protein
VANSAGTMENAANALIFQVMTPFHMMLYCTRNLMIIILIRIIKRKIKNKQIRNHGDTKREKIRMKNCARTKIGNGKNWGHKNWGQTTVIEQENRVYRGLSPIIP